MSLKSCSVYQSYFFEAKVLVEVKENDYDITLECDDDADIAIVYRQSLFLRLNKTIPTISLT